MSGARDTLRQIASRTGSMLSIGLEPSEAYMPPCFARTAAGRLEFLRAITDAADGAACAVKLNLAFFESLGVEGWSLLHEAREAVPASLLVIADAKRGDIGSSSEQYARSLYDVLGADAATVNPLMGRDAVGPFLERTDRITYALALTSNASAVDFLDRDTLAERIAGHMEEWCKEQGGANGGLVIGATRPERLAEVRMHGPSLAVLVPGIGAQGGSAAATAAALMRPDGSVGDGLLHVTRGVLPDANDESLTPAVFSARVRARIETLNAEIAAGLEAAASHKDKEPSAHA